MGDSENKDYMGDGVYADFDGYAVVLTTHNAAGIEATNTIVLEPEVLAAVNRYYERMKAIGNG